MFFKPNLKMLSCPDLISLVHEGLVLQLEPLPDTGGEWIWTLFKGAWFRTQGPLKFGGFCRSPVNTDTTPAFLAAYSGMPSLKLVEGSTGRAVDQSSLNAFEAGSLGFPGIPGVHHQGLAKPLFSFLGVQVLQIFA